MKVSPWFDLPKDMPVREGVYEVEIEGYSWRYFSYWKNGSGFGWVSRSVDDAMLDRDRRSLARHTKWRGIVK